MPDALIDGRGNGYAAGVDSNNRLMTDASLNLSGVGTLGSVINFSVSITNSGTAINTDYDVEQLFIQNINATTPVYFMMGSVGSTLCLASGCIIYPQEYVSMRVKFASGTGGFITLTGSASATGEVRGMYIY